MAPRNATARLGNSEFPEFVTLGTSCESPVRGGERATLHFVRAVAVRSSHRETSFETSFEARFPGCKLLESAELKL